MFYDGKILIGKSGEEDIYIYPKMANRHGLIAGATGTGKTVTLKVMAESFSDIGVPVFLADVKGDLSGMCAPGVESGRRWAFSNAASTSRVSLQTTGMYMLKRACL